MVTFLQRSFTSLVHAHAGRTQGAAAGQFFCFATKLPQSAALDLKMFYWNQSNFEGLKSIGEEYSSKNGYEDFANYCLLKEKGLKKEANQSINEFVSKIMNWPTQQQRELAQELTSLWFWHQNTHQLISYPLQQFIIKTLEEWCACEPNNASAHRWLGCMGGGIECFEKALNAVQSGHPTYGIQVSSKFTLLHGVSLKINWKKGL